MQSNLQQNIDYAVRNRQYKQSRAQALQQPLQVQQSYQRQPVSQYVTPQQQQFQGQKLGQYNEQMFHQHQQQSYLAKIERARELERSGQAAIAVGGNGGGGVRVSSFGDDRQSRNYFESSKPVLQVRLPPKIYILISYLLIFFIIILLLLFFKFLFLYSRSVEEPM